VVGVVESVVAGNDASNCQAKPLDVDGPALVSSGADSHQQIGVATKTFYGVRKRQQSLNVCRPNIDPIPKRKKCKPSRYND
jgi:hypothetical protein